MSGYDVGRLNESDVLPDPFSLSDGWLGEQAMSQWPALAITDIAEYLKERATAELYSKLLNEYKLGKAFRYTDTQYSTSSKTVRNNLHGHAPIN